MRAGGKNRSGGGVRRDWLFQFSEACRRITLEPDVAGLLKAVAHEARSIVGARYGATQVFDDLGLSRNFFTSGTATGEVEQTWHPSNGSGVPRRLSGRQKTPAIDDGSGRSEPVGLPEDPYSQKTHLDSPMRHLGEHVGNLHVSGKEDGLAFTSDEEMALGMLASHAAVVVANARIHKQEKQAVADLEALINISPVGVLVFDAKTGDLLSNNEETRRIVGSLNAPGRSLNQLLEVMSLRTSDGRDIPIDELPTSKALRSGETILADDVVIHPRDRRPVHTLVNARPIFGDDGEAVSVVATIQDITPLEEMKRQRTEFLGRVSHELRTPLSAIKGSTATMLGTPQSLGPTETRQFLRIIDEQADRMRHLINDLVDMTQIETGTLSLALEPTDMQELVELARDGFLGERVTHDIEITLAPDLPRVMADRRRVFQALSILLTDASDHSAESSTIRVSASQQGLDVAVSVEDEVGGEPADRIAHRFRRPSPIHGDDMVNRAGGDRLSLAICRGIVEAHGGRMSTESGAPGGGARFTFTVPMVDGAAQSAETGSGQPAAHPRRSRLEQARVLVLDEDPETLRYIRSTLREAGFTPVVTGNPDELERLVDVEKPHLVLMSPTLPWTDGFELMERVGTVSDAPVIFLSENSSDLKMDRAFELGAVDYVVKPFTQTELVARVRSALRRRLAPAQNEASEPFVLGDLAIDYTRRLVTVAGRGVQLTATEYRLLFQLSSNAGRVLTHEQLLRMVWGPLYSGDTGVVRTYVKQLRHKLGDDARSPRYIFTEPRVGYQMAKQAMD